MVHLFMIDGYHVDFEDDSKERVVLLQASRTARSSVWCQAQSGEGERERAREMHLRSNKFSGIGFKTTAIKET